MPSLGLNLRRATRRWTNSRTQGAWGQKLRYFDLDRLHDADQVLSLSPHSRHDSFVVSGDGDDAKQPTRHIRFIPTSPESVSKMKVHKQSKSVAAQKRMVQQQQQQAERNSEKELVSLHDRSYMSSMHPCFSFAHTFFDSV